METIWTALIAASVAALAVLLAFLIDSYVGVSGWLKSKPKAISAAA